MKLLDDVCCVLSCMAVLNASSESSLTSAHVQSLPVPANRPFWQKWASDASLTHAVLLLSPVRNRAAVHLEEAHPEHECPFDVLILDRLNPLILITFAYAH